MSEDTTTPDSTTPPEDSQVESTTPSEATTAAATVTATPVTSTDTAATTPVVETTSTATIAPSSGTLSTDTAQVVLAPGSDAAKAAADAAAAVNTTVADFKDVIAKRAQDAREVELGIDGLTTELKAAILKILDSGSVTAKNFIAHVLQHAKAMGPNSLVDNAVGETHHINLFAAIRNAIDNGENDFREMLGVFLAFVHQTKEQGAWRLDLMFRYLPSMKLGSEDRTCWQNLLTLFRNTSGVQGRAQALKQVNLQEAIKGLTPQGQQRLTVFYKA